MATVSELRRQAKARKIKGYSKMNKSQLQSALGVSSDAYGDMRKRDSAQAKGIAKKHGVAQTFAADRLAEKLAQSSPYYGHGSPKENIRGWLLDRVKSDLRKAQRKNGGKPLSQDQKRAVAVKALKDEATQIRKKHAEQREDFNRSSSKPQEPAKAEKGKEKRSTASKPKAEPKPKAEKKPKAEPKAKAEKPKSDDPQDHPKRHSIKSQEDFNNLALHTIDKLDKEGNRDGLVPIYKVRRAMGELVPRDKFDSYLKKMQTNDTLQLQGGSVEDLDHTKIQDSVSTPVSGVRTYIKVLDHDAVKNLKDRDSLDKQLHDRPELDPLGTARELTKGKKIKTQADFNEVVKDAGTRLHHEFKYDNIIPIHHLRKALGDRVKPADFDKFLKGMGSATLMENAKASKEEEDGGVKGMLGTKHHVKFGHLKGK